MSWLICIPVMLCSFLLVFFFFSYLTVESSKSNTLSPLRQRNGDIYSVCRLMGTTLERVMTVWVSDISPGWSLCPCRCSQLDAGSSRCSLWAGTWSVTQCFRAGKGMPTGLLFPSSAAQPCPGRAKSSLTSFAHSWHSSGMAEVGISI